MALENGKGQFYGNIEISGSLRASGIIRLIKALTTRKRIGTWLDYGSGNNGITGETLEPYTKKELATILWPNSKDPKMVKFLDEDKIKSMGYDYRLIVKELTLALSILYCRTRFVEDKISR